MSPASFMAPSSEGWCHFQSLPFCGCLPVSLLAAPCINALNTRSIIGDISAAYEQYLGIWDVLKNITLLGIENGPNTKNGTYGILCHYRNPTSQHQEHTPPGAVTFIKRKNEKNNKKVPGNNGISFADVSCYRCLEMGHYAGNCP